MPPQDPGFLPSLLLCFVLRFAVPDSRGVFPRHAQSPGRKAQITSERRVCGAPPRAPAPSHFLRRRRKRLHKTRTTHATRLLLLLPALRGQFPAVSRPSHVPPSASLRVPARVRARHCALVHTTNHPTIKIGWAPQCFHIHISQKLVAVSPK